MAKKLLFVIAPEDFRDEEFTIPVEILRQEGINIFVASLKEGVCKGAGGTEVESDYKVEEIKPADFDGVVFIGGPGMSELINNFSFINLAKAFYQEKKLVAAICVAPMVLANAGILKGVSATIWQGSIQDFQQEEVDVSTKPVVTAGRIITANGPQAAKKFAQAIIKFLKENQ